MPLYQKEKKSVKNLPAWFKQELPADNARAMAKLLEKYKVNTVCRQALCPNSSCCFKKGEATFIILGGICTRNCRFCAVEKIGVTKKLSVDCDEPQRVSSAIAELKINYAVITSVTRDDLVDGGAEVFVETIKAIRRDSNSVKIETLIPDFSGNCESVKAVASVSPEVIAHNIEMPERLYKIIRPQADYQRSLLVLKKIKEFNRKVIIKSSLILGLGEIEDEIIEAMRDLRAVGCDIIVLGQDLAPSSRHYPVYEFITPEQFDKYGDIARRMGFGAVLSEPLARSSYKAQELYRRVLNV